MLAQDGKKKDEVPPLLEGTQTQSDS